MEYQFTIDGTLPNLNDLIAAERQQIRVNGKFTTKGNELKQTNQELVIWHLRKYLRGVHINKPIRIKYTFYEPNRKRDLDNISAFGEGTSIYYQIFAYDSFGAMSNGLKSATITKNTF